MWGNFNAMLAKKQVMAVTVLQRLVATLVPDITAPVTSVALSGSSKGGGSAWAAALSDARVTVAAAMHDQAQNLTAFLNGIETSWGCTFACTGAGGGGGTGQNGTAAMVLRKWLQTTQAGGAALKMLSPADYYVDSGVGTRWLSPTMRATFDGGNMGGGVGNSASTTTTVGSTFDDDFPFAAAPPDAPATTISSTFAEPGPSPVDFWLLAGDVGGCDMHDGHHFPLGVESLFLDALTNNVPSSTFRYHRCSRCPACSACKGSTWHSRRVGLIWMLGRRLLDGRSFEVRMPKVQSAVAVAATAGTVAEGGGAAEGVESRVPGSADTSFVVHATVLGGGPSGDNEAVAGTGELQVTLW